MNKPIRSQIASALITVGFITYTAIATADPGMHGDGKGKFMSFFDSNNDNIVTLDELNAASIKRFSAMDADGNGRVTEDEFSTYVNERRTEHKMQAFNNIDSNGDNQISKEEYLSYKAKQAEQRYSAMDANADGIVTKDEFDSALAKRHGNKHGRYVEGRSHHNRGRIFSRLDKNNDGELTLDESLAAWTDWFKRIDANGDQIVTADEIQNFRKQWREK